MTTTSEVKKVLTDPICFLAFGFGSGLATKAPGTFGTLAAIPIYCLMAAFLTVPMYWLGMLIVMLVGVPICGQAAQKLGVHDHPGIVWDEIAGFLLTMAWAPFTWPAIVIGFLLFRLFDILKPWPIRWLDRQVHGGLGIMLDDLLAGLFAAACLFLIGHFGWLPAA